jgi:hypothetical protein
MAVHRHRLTVVDRTIIDLRWRDALQPTLPVGHPGRGLVAALAGAVLRVLRRISRLRLVQASSAAP